MVEDVDSVAAICYTNATNIRWYVDYTLVSSNDRMTISPDLQTLIIHRVTRRDRALYCEIDTIMEIPRRSEILSLTVACEWSGAMRVMPVVGTGPSSDITIRQAELERGNTMSQPMDHWIWV